jgi:hypothetical protein
MSWSESSDAVASVSGWSVGIRIEQQINPAMMTAATISGSPDDRDRAIIGCSGINDPNLATSVQRYRDSPINRASRSYGDAASPTVVFARTSRRRVWCCLTGRRDHAHRVGTTAVICPRVHAVARCRQRHAARLGYPGVTRDRARV